MQPFKLQLSRQNPNTRAHSELAFEKGGIWEQHQGPNQTRRFAECCNRHCRIPWQEFSLLDVGCALGDALDVWHQVYPAAKLFGCDVADAAVQRCRERYGHLAEFFRASFEEIEGVWDVIFCSNVLEHFEQHLEIAEALIARCKVLLVLTPFAELKDGSPLGPRQSQGYHMATFFRNSFDVLVDRGSASRVETSIFSCPHGGWGLSSWQRVRWLAGSIVKGRHILQEPLQILYAIHSRGCPDCAFVLDQGRYPR